MMIDVYLFTTNPAEGIRGRLKTIIGIITFPSINEAEAFIPNVGSHIQSVVPKLLHPPEKMPIRRLLLDPTNNRVGTRESRPPK
jgi:hypothetical protein